MNSALISTVYETFWQGSAYVLSLSSLHGMILSNASLQQTYTYIAVDGPNIKVNTNTIKRIVKANVHN